MFLFTNANSETACVATGTSTGESAPVTKAAPPGTERQFYRVMRE